MTTSKKLPFEATHPGTLLYEELKARGIKQKELAEKLGVLPTFLNEIIKKRNDQLLLILQYYLKRP